MKSYKKGRMRFKDWFTIYLKPAIYENKSFWIFIIVFLVIAILILKLKNQVSDEFWNGVLVEATGFLFDIFLFGIVFTIYDSISDKKKLIQSYKDEIAFFEGLDFDEATLRIIGNIRLLNRYKNTEIELADTVFKNTYIGDLNLTNSLLQDIDFIKCRTSNLIFESTFNRINNYVECEISGSDFNNCKYEYSDFENCVLFDTTFENAYLRELNFKNSLLSEVSFKNAKLEKVSFDFCVVDDEVWLEYLGIDKSYHTEFSEKYIAIESKTFFTATILIKQAKFKTREEDFKGYFETPYFIIDRKYLPILEALNLPPF